PAGRAGRRRARGPPRAAGRPRAAGAARSARSPARAPPRASLVRALGHGPHRPEDVPLVGIAADELLEPVDDRLRRVLDVARGLPGALDEDRRQRDPPERVVPLAGPRGDDDRPAGDAPEA